jgi:lysophospholipase L1-like esterase
MNRRLFLGGYAALLGASTASPTPSKTKDLKKEPFRRMVIMGESTVEGGGWLVQREGRFADILAGLISSCQEKPVEYINKGIGANAISPRSPGYEKSRKPSAMERYKADVIALNPDLFVLCYGLNDMRAGMPLQDFQEDLATIMRDVKAACSPMIVLTTVYYMTGWHSFAPYDKGSPALTRIYNACIRGLAEEYDCVLADVWGAEGEADWLIHPDGVHANRVGNLLIAHRIFEAIAQHASGLTNWTFAQDQNTTWTRNTTKARESSGDPFTKTW